MNGLFQKMKRWSLGAVAAATFLGGVFALTSCGGEGGPVGVTGGGSGTDDSITKQFQALLPAGQANATYVGSAKCGECHNGSGGYPDYYGMWKDTTHAALKVGCEQCHGPGSAHVAGPSTDNILVLPKLSSPVVCGQCHGPMFKDYMSSAHAELIPDPIQSAITSPAGQVNSRCIVCHSGDAHIEFKEIGDITKASNDDIVAVANATINDVPFIASCATCHNPHKKTGNLTQEGKESQLWHPVTNTDPTPILPGTTASSFTNFEHICAQCHNGRGANGADSALKTGTTRPNMHDSNQYNMLFGVGGSEGAGVPSRTTAHSMVPGQCSKCHMPNSRHTFTVSFDGSCQPCHTPVDAAVRADTAKQYTTSALYQLRVRLQAWSQATFGDPDLWDYTSLIPAGKTAPNQSLVPIEIRRARHNYYYVVRDKSFGIHNLPYTKTLVQVANDNLDAVGASKAPFMNVSQSQMQAALKADAKRAHIADAQGDMN